jgi:hypothetical protein
MSQKQAHKYCDFQKNFCLLKKSIWKTPIRSQVKILDGESDNCPFHSLNSPHPHTDKVLRNRIQVHLHSADNNELPKSNSGGPKVWLDIGLGKNFTI